MSYILHLMVVRRDAGATVIFDCFMHVDVFPRQNVGETPVRVRPCRLNNNRSAPSTTPLCAEVVGSHREEIEHDRDCRLTRWSMRIIVFLVQGCEIETPSAEWFRTHVRSCDGVYVTHHKQGKCCHPTEFSSWGAEWRHARFSRNRNVLPAISH